MSDEMSAGQEPIDWTLSDDWERWVTESALEGATARELIDELVSEGITPTLATREVTRTLGSVAFKMARAWRREALRLRQSNALNFAVNMRNRPPEVERREGVSPDELRRRYLSGSQPVILTDVARDWPALTRWTDEGLKERVGHLPITFSQGTADNPRTNQDVKLFQTDGRFGEFIDRVASAGRSNELYLIGNHNVLSNEGMEVLFEDLSPKVETYLEGGIVRKKSSLWFGPAGTHTSLHYDPLSVLYAQIRGVKRFRLISPLSRTLLLNVMDSNYFEMDWERLPKELEGQVYELELRPGEVLFLPTCWWHDVYALSPSVSLGFLNIKGEHHHPWYRPGLIR